MEIAINTGADGYAASPGIIDGDRFGFRFTGYRDIDRFLDQTTEAPFGIIGWPGGYLAEDRHDLFGWEHDGLTGSGFTSLSDMMDIANSRGMGLAVTVPTMEWHDDLDGLRARVQAFGQDFFSGRFGEIPDRFIMEIGSEFYGHAAHQGMTAEEMAPIYGQISSVIIEELTAIMDDPTVNTSGARIEFGVQGGRTEAEADLIHSGMSDEALEHTDLIVLARMPLTVSGVDRAMGNYEALMDNWTEAVHAVGGDDPTIFMTSFNVASPTRSEAVDAFINTKADEGIIVHEADLDVEGRTNAEFEQFWQDRIDRFHLGYEQPRVLMELFSEFHELGMTSGTAFGVDQAHPGRLSFQDEFGNAQSLIGMDFLHMLYESIDETHMLDVSTDNHARTDFSTYGFEGDDHMTLFVIADGNSTGDVTLNIEGLFTDFKAVWTESLVAEIPEDWMTRYDIPDTEGVDETPEGWTFADGVRTSVDPVIDENGLTVHFSHPGEVIRIALAKTDAGVEDLRTWVHDPDASIELDALAPVDETADPAAGANDAVDASALITEHVLGSDEGASVSSGDPAPAAAAEDAPVEGTADGASLSGLLMFALPFLALLGLA